MAIDYTSSTFATNSDQTLANMASNRGSSVGGNTFSSTSPILSETQDLPYMGLNGTPAWDSYSRPTTQAGSTGTTTETERLYRILPRSAKKFNGTNKNPDPTFRGDIAYIRLKANKNIDSTARPKIQGNDYSEDLATLVSDAAKYDSFFMTSYHITYSEKTQITPTFGDSEVVYYFGRQPVIAQISGLLFDSLDQNWFSRFVTLYWAVLRGSRLAASMELVELVLPNVKLVGTISGMAHSQDANNDSIVQFNFDFIVKELVYIPTPKLTTNTSTGTSSLLNFMCGPDSTLPMANINRVKDAVLSSRSSLNLSTLGSANNNALSPIFGIISDITKSVKTATGDLTSILSRFTAPLNSVLRDITSVARQATALAGLVSSSVNSIVNIPLQAVNNIRSTLSSLRMAAGVISHLPDSISGQMRRLILSGNISGTSAILSSSTPSLGGQASLFSGAPMIQSKIALLSSGAEYSPSKAGTL